MMRMKADARVRRKLVDETPLSNTISLLDKPSESTSDFICDN